MCKENVIELIKENRARTEDFAEEHGLWVVSVYHEDLFTNNVITNTAYFSDRLDGEQYYSDKFMTYQKYNNKIKFFLDSNLGESHRAYLNGGLI